MEDKLLIKINETLKQANKSPFYKKKGITQNVKSIEGFRSISTTKKEEIRDSDPFDMLCIGIDKLQQYHETTGTTGKPTSVWYSRNDMITAVKQTEEAGLKIKSTDIVAIRFPYALSVPAHLLSSTFTANGAAVIPISRGSTVTPYKRVIDIMRNIKATILACNISEAVILADIAEKMGYDVRKDFNIRAICTAGEMLSPKRKKYIENIWNAKIFNYYGTTETAHIALDCENGELHCSDDYYCEVADLHNSGRVREYGKGILYLTQLNNETFPLIRYDTSDIVEIKESQCSCGSKKRIMIHHGRVADLIRVGDKQCTMYEFQEALFECNELEEKKYWRIKIMDEEVITYIEGNPPVTGREICLNLPFHNKVIVVEKGKVQDIDKMLEHTVLRKADYFISKDKIYENM